ncbi:MAG: hypothetical protein KAS58_08470, partial [Calditrichia bacterium]|nr:hypothetical protein [Calditrichia bacterium]
RPYDNLGVPGADLNDLLNTIDGSGGNPFFDMILRNPTLLNTTQLQQVSLLQPTVLLLWAGNNDVLGAALDGGDLNQITPQNEFDDMMESIIDQVTTDLPKSTVIMANIPSVTDMPYVNTLDPVIVGGVPFVFDTLLNIIDFGEGLNLPLVTEEIGIAHITLVGLPYYQNGIGVPDSAYMVDNLTIPAPQASLLQAGMIAAGLTPTGIALGDTVTISITEESAIADAVTGFNNTISSLTTSNNIALVDANLMLSELNTSGIDGASGLFVLLDPATTAFSLDGVHPNNAGYAIVANAFIGKINAALQLETPIPEVDVSSKFGQYLPPSSKMEIGKVINNVRVLFSRKN